MSLPETYKAIISQEDSKSPKLVELPLPKPETDQVLVKIEFAPLHPYDIAMMNGEFREEFSPPYLVGCEGSGIVAAIGKDLKVPHKVGDKVYVSGVGTMGQYTVTTSENVAPIEEGLSLEEAANHFANPGTVYYMGVLAERGGHKAVINHPGASSLGRMMIRYFKHKGIKVISIVRRDEYIDELKAEGSDYVLNSQAPDFEERLKEAAKNVNATMGLDAIGGELTNTIFKALQPKSVLYMYDWMGDSQIKNLDIKEFFNKKTITQMNLFEYVEEVAQKGELTKFYKEVHSLLPTVFSTKITKIFSLDDYEEAMAFYKHT